MEKKQVWISASKPSAIHLVDKNTIVENKYGIKDYQRIDITQKMAEQDIPILVINSGFVRQYYQDPINLLKVWLDEAAAKKKHDEYFKIVEIEQKTEAEDKKQESKATEEAIKKSREAFEVEYKKQMQKNGATPRVIRRNRTGEERTVA